MEDRLWDFIDGTASAEEKAAVEKLLAADPVWKAKYEELLGVHQEMQQHLELEHPPLRFTQNVMEEIARSQIAPAASKYINKKIIRSIAAFFIITITAFFIYGLTQLDWTASESNSNFNIPVVDASKLNVTEYFNSTTISIFLVVIVVLGLRFLDLYLSKKRRKFREG